MRLTTPRKRIPERVVQVWNPAGIKLVTAYGPPRVTTDAITVILASVWDTICYAPVQVSRIHREQPAEYKKVHGRKLFLPPVTRSGAQNSATHMVSEPENISPPVYK